MASPQRTCVGCRRVDDKSRLTRFVIVDGQLVLDADWRLAGRGSYLHMDKGCLEQARRRGGFSRSYRKAIDADDALAALIGLGLQAQIR